MIRTAVLLALASSLAAAAAYTGAAWDSERRREVTVLPTAPDGLFEPGTPPSFIVVVQHRATSASWQLRRQGLTTVCASGTAEPGTNGSFRIAPPADRLRPGFYDMVVQIDVGAEKPIETRAGFGWQIDEARLSTPKPDDHAAFWAARQAELAGVPVDLRIEDGWTRYDAAAINRYNVEHAWQPPRPYPAGERYAEVEVAKLSFASVGGTRIHAWFTRPVGTGPFPGVLVLPGAGNRWRPMPLEHARQGFAALDIQVHGEPVDLPNDRYAKLDRDDPTDPERLRHTAIYLHALRACAVLAELPSVDASRLALDGSSQGGRLAIVVAAWDPRPRAVVAQLTHFAGRSHGVWAKEQNRARRDGLDSDPDASAAVPHGEAMLDVLHLAPAVRVPVFLNAGLDDDVSPPETIVALRRALSGPTTLVTMPAHGHEPVIAADRLAWAFLHHQLAAGP